MKKHLKKAMVNPLIFGSAIMFIGSIGANGLNFLYNVFMSRNLTIEDYGILASITSLIVLASIPSGAVIPTIINFTSSSFAKKDYSYIRGLYFQLIKPLVVIGVVFFLIFIIFSDQIGEFFNIGKDKSLLVLAGFTVLLSFGGVVNGALLQARLSFRFISFNGFLSSLVKLGLGVWLVFFGYQVVGAMWAFMVSYLVGFIISFIPLRFLFNFKIQKIQINPKEIYLYGLPSAVALFSLTSLVSMDLILVKHFFSPNEAGLYAGLSLVGRVIFFFSAPIGSVMFPIIVRKYAKQESYYRSFGLALMLVLLSSVSITVFYFLFPEFVIRLFLKNEIYLTAVPYLGFFGVFMTLYSICSVFMYYFLSIKRTWIYRPILLVAILQAVLIYIFHSSFGIIISISIVSVLSLTIFFITYLLLSNKSANKKLSY